ncbi:hypothetical protein KSX_04580 [Ktedonospora formicarum]|uniref:Uncharacterized protein n=2 Tax=Ktedonospora formicarum TaxID=2778364 RepID=A0A8J3MNV2_9CHLR|nr:hypothetical protein KSX_04580 [Ktedonospora formicarum]
MGLPAWYVPPSLSRLESWGDLCPDGFYNCGLAHGIPGPLALLALTKSAHISVPGLEEAITRTADWLLEQQVGNEWGIGWPLAVPVNHMGPPPGDLKKCRTAWCYGTPGVARALWLAGEALNCQHYRDIALVAMQSVYRTPLPERRIDSPSFCHGVAGLLQITLRFAHNSQAPFFIEAANTLTKQLLSLYDPDTLLGYRNQEGPETLVDQPGLLDGVAGILLVLLATSTTQEPYWDRLFLLS